jgi:HEAT repeat protein
MKLLLLLFTFSIFVQGCSKNTTKSGPKPPQANNPTTPSTSPETANPSDNQPADSQNYQFKETYRFIFNGCPTGPQVFGSNTSAEDARNKLCAGLQNNKLNHFCAEPMRLAHFNLKCLGQKWISQNPPESPPSSDSSIVEEVLSRAKIEAALLFLLAKESQIKAGLTEDDRSLAIKLITDMDRCGFSYLGPSCLNNDIMANSSSTRLIARNESKILFTEFNLEGERSRLAFLFHVVKVKPSILIESVELIKIVSSFDGSSVDQFLNDPANFLNLATITISKNSQSDAIESLTATKDIRQLFHLSRMLLSMNIANKNYRTTQSLIASMIAQHHQLIAKTDDSQYLEALLHLIIDQLDTTKSGLVGLCTQILSSSPIIESLPSLKQIAAVFVLEAQPDRTDLKPTVLQAVQNSYWSIRKMALMALSKTKITSTEQNILIRSIDDPDADVQLEATTIVRKFNINQEHLPEVAKLATSMSWTVRRESANLLSTINSPESIMGLINMLADSDGDVRTAVMSHLKSKTLSHAMIQPLALNFKATAWTVRRDVAILLGKIKSPDSRDALINQLAVESDTDVQKQLRASLKALKTP